MRRAAHQLYDEAPLVFADPLALRVLSEEARAELTKREEMERTHPFARGMRAFLCARSRFAEDALELAVANGVRQYVVLGAGLDKWLHQQWIYIAGIILGCVAGFIQIFRLVLGQEKAMQKEDP